MTMTEGTTPTPPPSAFPFDLTPSHKMYGFEIDTRVDQPIPKGPDWFSRQERYRRNANAQAYQQYGHPTNWNRYVNLGLFVFEDCFKCDKVWAAIETNALMVHRAIWYNFMCHVDRELQVPVQSNAWATNISQPYLVTKPADTIDFSWKEMHFFKKDEMDIDDVEAPWIPVPGRRRLKSPPNQQNTTTNEKTNKVVGSFAPGFNLPPEELPENYRPMDDKRSDQGHTTTMKNNNNAIVARKESAAQSNNIMQDKKVKDLKESTSRQQMTDKDVQKDN